MRNNHGCAKHITAVVEISAVGHRALHFFIMEGVRISSVWWAPIEGYFRKDPHGIIERFTKANWFLANDAVIKMSSNGSMEGDLLERLVKHMDKYVK